MIADERRRSRSPGWSLLTSPKVATEDALTIGRLASRLDVNPRTIRFYEKIGLLPEPARSPAGYRLYSHEDEERLRFVRSAQLLGLTLGEIKEVLAFRDNGEHPCRYVAKVLEERLGEISGRIRELRALKRELTALVERMRAEGIAEREAAFCHYLEGAASPSEPRSPSSR